MFFNTNKARRKMKNFWLRRIEIGKGVKDALQRWKDRQEYRKNFNDEFPSWNTESYHDFEHLEIKGFEDE